MMEKTRKRSGDTKEIEGGEEISRSIEQIR
jgi:hypothetical protein